MSKSGGRIGRGSLPRKCTLTGELGCLPSRCRMTTRARNPGRSTSGFSSWRAAPSVMANTFSQSHFQSQTAANPVHRFPIPRSHISQRSFPSQGMGFFTTGSQCVQKPRNPGERKVTFSCSFPTGAMILNQRRFGRSGRLAPSIWGGVGGFAVGGCPGASCAIWCVFCFCSRALNLPINASIFAWTLSMLHLPFVCWGVLGFFGTRFVRDRPTVKLLKSLGTRSLSSDGHFVSKAEEET